MPPGRVKVNPRPSLHCSGLASHPSAVHFRACVALCRQSHRPTIDVSTAVRCRPILAVRRVLTRGVPSVLANSQAFSGFSTNDIAAAQRFYRESLGLNVAEVNGMLTLTPAGNIVSVLEIA